MIFKVFVLLNLFAIIANSSGVTLTGIQRSSRATTRVLLLNWKNYVREVAQEFIYELEEFGLCNIFLKDFEQNISAHFFEYEVIGKIKYTNGFVGTLQSAEIKQNTESNSIIETSSSSLVKCTLFLNDLTVFFDFHADLTTGMQSGTLEIPIKTIEFAFQVNHSYSSNKTTGYIYAVAVTGAVDKYSKWTFEPSTKYTEIIHRELIWLWNMKNDLDILSNTTLLNLLENVIQRKKYPEICFNCNEKTDNTY